MNLTVPEGHGFLLINKNGEVETVLCVSRNITALKKAESDSLQKTHELNETIKELNCTMCNIVLMKDATGEIKGTLGAVRDVSNLKQAEYALQASEQRYREMVEFLPSGIIEIDTDLNLTFVNPAGFEILGFTLQDLEQGINAVDLIHPDDQAKVAKRLFAYQAGEYAPPIDYRLIKKDGSEITALVKSLTIYREDKIGGYMVSVTDITDRRRAEEKVRASLNEKEILLQEIHHRVKNNMTVISSLLNLHSNTTRNQEVKEALRESQGRVHAMAAVHESLYGADNLAAIDLFEYLHNLSSNLIATYAIDADRIQFKISGDGVSTDIKIAYPLGLTFNELISNALKYAFPDNRAGTIEVTTRRQGDLLELTFQDDGVGMAEGFNWQESRSLGMKLVHSLIVNQLDGSIAMHNANGTRYTITIKMNN